MTQSIIKVFSIAVLMFSQNAFGYDELAIKISELEARAEHLSIQGDGLRTSFKSSFDRLQRNRDGTVDTFSFLETKKLNREAAEKVLDGADDIYSEAVVLLKRGKDSRLGFFTAQQGENISLGQRVFAAMQVVECVKFSTQLIFQNQNMSEASLLAETVSKECSKIVRLMRNEITKSDVDKKKK